MPACGPSVGDVAFQRGHRYAAGLWGNPRRIGLSSLKHIMAPFILSLPLPFSFDARFDFLSLVEGPGSKDRGSWHAYLVRFIFNIYPCVSLFPNSLKQFLVGGLEHEFYDFPFSWEE